jgi:hypothetical protein
VAALMMHDAKEMKCVGIARLALDQAVINPGRVGVATLLMAVKGDIELGSHGGKSFEKRASRCCSDREFWISCQTIRWAYGF